MDSKKERFKWIAIGAGAVLLVLVVFTAGMHFGGRKGGQEKETEQPASGEKTDAATAETESPKETPVPSPQQEAEPGEGVSQGRYLYIANDVILFYMDDRLGSGMISQDGSVTDVVREGTMKGRFYGLTAEGSVLYFTCTEGIYKMDLKEKGQPVQLCERTSNRPFSVFDGYLYFIIEDTVYRVSTDGGQMQPLISGVADFIVTNQEIYYIANGGRLYRSDYEGKASQQAAEADAGAKLLLWGDNLYIQSEEVWRYDIPKKKIEQVPLEQKCQSDRDIWVTNQCLLYESEEGEARQYLWETGEEKMIGNVYIPSRHSGQLYGDFIYYSFNTGDVSWLNLKDFSDEDVDVEAALYAPKETVLPSPAAEEASDYNIAANLSLDVGDQAAQVISDHFTLNLDSQDYADGLWGWDVTGSDSMVFYYQAAREAGFGGVVFWLEAYDWGSNGYDQLPAYKIAGLTNDKKYIISFATDVQYDSSSQEQTRNYQRLREFAQRIDQDREDNPLTVR